jgi:hypothetical protein
VAAVAGLARRRPEEAVAAGDVRRRAEEAAAEAAVEGDDVQAGNGNLSSASMRAIFFSQVNASPGRRTAWLRMAAAGVLVCAILSPASAQQSFDTPQAAAEALVNAARAGNAKGIVNILGYRGADIVLSGDAVADVNARERFVGAYDSKHDIDKVGDSNATLVVGTSDYPFPIPLVRKGDRWAFDTAAGRREILYRRIGRNELAAIQTSLAYVDAQNEYAELSRAGNAGSTYAQRFLSQTGKKDGLYWPASRGDAASPLGELVAGATAEGYRAGARPTPYHGYYFRILTRQGPDAPGGALNYVAQGKMIGGYALVAYPAEYRNSGVMTFIVNHAGDVFQKDLGPRTARIASSMTSYNPDQTWSKVDTANPAR